MPRRRSISILTLVATLQLACGAGDANAPIAAAPEVVVETEGTTTRVNNVSGSVWGNRGARLEQELSIGVEEGADAYMFGDISSVAMVGDDILVLDQQAATVRRYGPDGRHVGNIGREGQGPSEFDELQTMATGPEGRIYVRDAGRIHVFDSDGELLETLSTATGFSTSTPIVVTDDGTVYYSDLLNQSEDVSDWKMGLIGIAPDGSVGDPIEGPQRKESQPEGFVELRLEGMISRNGVPFWPSSSWQLTSMGDTLSGFNATYDFVIERSDGSRLEISRWWEPITVDPDEALWRRRNITRNYRSQHPTWTWNGPEIPLQRPAFDQLLAARDGRIWVARVIAEPERLVDCDPNPLEVEEGLRAESCWRTRDGFDVFRADGHYLGEVALPEGLRMYPYPTINGDVLVGVAQDELGTAYVRRYRLVTEAES